MTGIMFLDRSSTILSTIGRYYYTRSAPLACGHERRSRTIGSLCRHMHHKATSALSAEHGTDIPDTVHDVADPIRLLRRLLGTAAARSFRPLVAARAARLGDGSVRVHVPLHLQLGALAVMRSALLSGLPWMLLSWLAFRAGCHGFSGGLHRSLCWTVIGLVTLEVTQWSAPCA